MDTGQLFHCIDEGGFEQSFNKLEHQLRVTLNGSAGKESLIWVMGMLNSSEH